MHLNKEDIIVPDEVYETNLWANATIEVPTNNCIRDKILELIEKENNGKSNRK